jgi:hypothetical protein
LNSVDVFFNHSVQSPTSFFHVSATPSHRRVKSSKDGIPGKVISLGYIFAPGVVVKDCVAGESWCLGRRHLGKYLATNKINRKINSISTLQK